MADAPRLSPFAKPSPWIERIAAATLGVSAIWLVLVGAYAVGYYGAEPPPEAPAGPTALLFVLAAIGPAALLGLSAMLLRRAEAIRAEAESLRALLENWRGPGFEGSGEAAQDKARAAAKAAGAESARLLGPRLDALETRLTAALAEIETLSGARADRTPAAPRPAPAPGQPGLPLEQAPPERGRPSPVTWAQVTRALEFPKSDDDAEAFAAIEAALRDPAFRDLLQAAEDVLTLLAALGLHMEDLTPEPASPEAWKAYAEGARGARAAAVGGVRDEAALEAARARMREDPVFRDAALVFARRWNALIARVAAERGADPLMVRLADTRSGRAFQLVARALGAFD